MQGTEGKQKKTQYRVQDLDSKLESVHWLANCPLHSHCASAFVRMARGSQGKGKNQLRNGYTDQGRITFSVYFGKHLPLT